MPLSGQAIYDLAVARFAGAVADFVPAVAADAKDGARDDAFKVAANRLLDVMTWLRDQSDLKFDFLQNVTAIEWAKQNQLQMVYHLFSYAHRHEIVIKVDLPRERPRLESVTGLWRNADWLEREQYDLLGVVFEGHPDLRRLLMPDDWVGHPMRKDYKEPAEYRGMPTTRPSPIELLLTYDKAHAAKPDKPPA